MKIFILTWLYAGRVTIVKESPFVQVIQLEKKRLSKLSQYKNGRFEIRTKEGLKHKPILKPETR